MPFKHPARDANLVLFFRDAPASVRQEGLELSHIKLQGLLYTPGGESASPPA